jgi:hypothetical protein
METIQKSKLLIYFACAYMNSDLLFFECFRECFFHIFCIYDNLRFWFNVLWCWIFVTVNRNIQSKVVATHVGIQWNVGTICGYRGVWGRLSPPSGPGETILSVNRCTNGEIIYFSDFGAQFISFSVSCRFLVFFYFILKIHFLSVRLKLRCNILWIVGKICLIKLLFLAVDKVVFNIFSSLFIRKDSEIYFSTPQ